MRKIASLLVATVAVAVLGTGAAFGVTHQTTEARARHRTIRVHGSGSAVGRAAVNGGVVTFETHGAFRLSPLGRFTFRVHGTCTNADCSTFNATTVYLAARGDSFTTYGSATGDLFTEYLIRGTRRFAGASGTMTETGTTVADPSDPLAISGTFEIKGTIRTPGHPCRPHH